MFVTFEGIEGSGKTTIIGKLADFLKNRGDDPVITREPGASSLGKLLRSLLLDTRTTNLAADAELCLFLADRAQHLEEVIRPALFAGKIIICDRFCDSTLAYQGYGRGMDLPDLEQFNALATRNLAPDLTFLLDLPVREGLARANKRNKAEGTAISEGRFDCESLNFHEKVRTGYLELAKKHPRRIVTLDATKTPDEVFKQCLESFLAHEHRHMTN